MAKAKEYAEKLKFVYEQSMKIKLKPHAIVEKIEDVSARGSSWGTLPGDFGKKSEFANGNKNVPAFPSRFKPK